MIKANGVSGDPGSVSVTGWLYKLNGCSQPSLITASDGSFYVVKFNGFPGRDGLMNEVVGTELARRVGFPTPNWRPVQVSDGFLDEHPGMWYRQGNTVIRPRAGLHFGSQLAPDGQVRRVYQVIPREWWGHVDNRADFVGMVVLDCWMNNCDRRQAIFVRTAERGFRAYFVDFDHALGGRHRDRQACPRVVMVPDLTAYKGVWSLAAADRAKRAIEEIGEDWIASMLQSVPESWRDDAMVARAFAELLLRRHQLDAFIREADFTLTHSHSVPFNRPRCATVPRFLHDLGR